MCVLEAAAGGGGERFVEKTRQVGRGAGIGSWPPDHSDLPLPVLLPADISSVTAQAAEPRVSGWGPPESWEWGQKEGGGLALDRTSWPSGRGLALRLSLTWSGCPALLFLPVRGRYPAHIARI